MTSNRGWRFFITRQRRNNEIWCRTWRMHDEDDGGDDTIGGDGDEARWSLFCYAMVKRMAIWWDGKEVFWVKVVTLRSSVTTRMCPEWWFDEDGEEVLWVKVVIPRSSAAMRMCSGWWFDEDGEEMLNEGGNVVELDCDEDVLGMMVWWGWRRGADWRW